MVQFCQLSEELQGPTTIPMELRSVLDEFQEVFQVPG